MMASNAISTSPAGVISRARKISAGAYRSGLSEVVDDLRNRGVSDVKIFIEGCRDRRGRRVRFTFDEYGNSIDRERMGSCK